MNGANLKQVADVKIGGYQVELDEDKLRQLSLICDDCDNTISLIQKTLNAQPIYIAGDADGLAIIVRRARAILLGVPRAKDLVIIGICKGILLQLHCGGILVNHLQNYVRRGVAHKSNHISSNRSEIALAICTGVRHIFTRNVLAIAAVLAYSQELVAAGKQYEGCQCDC